VERGIWPTKTFWRGDPYARPLAGFKRAASQWRGGGNGGERNGKGEEGQEGGKGEERKVGTGPPIG